MSEPYRALVACVTVDILTVTEAVRYYRPDEVHLCVHLNTPFAALGKIYKDHYDQVVSRIREMDHPVRIVEHNTSDVTSYRDMANRLGRINNSIKSEHPDAVVYAGISSGAQEFAVALGVFASLNSNVILFRMRPLDVNVGQDLIASVFYGPDGEARGLYSKVT